MMKSFFIWLSKRRGLERFIMKFSFAKRASKRFVPGYEIQDGANVVKELNNLGITATFDHLGENVNTKEESLQSANEYLNILNVINDESLQSHVSLKPTQMGLDVGFDVCCENIKNIVSKAKEANNFVRVDMESTEYTQVTLDLVRKIREEFDNVGIVIQAYLRRSEEDINALIKEGCRVRLCKGAYKEPKDKAFPKKKEVDENYIKLAKMLLSKESLNKNNYPAFATHDEGMINWIKRFTNDNKIDKKAFEFQMLYGIRRDLQEQLAKEGYNMRVYVCYGKEWYPYFMRRLAERPANFFFILKNFFK